jgi:hypothetical protein
MELSKEASRVPFNETLLAVKETILWIYEEVFFITTK